MPWSVNATERTDAPGRKLGVRVPGPRLGF
jgi:hypothetical protein